MIFDSDEPPLSPEELQEVKQNAEKRVVLWRERCLYSAAAFLLSCAFLYLFLAGSPLHRYWESFGRFFVLVSMAVYALFVYCAALWWGAWRALRDLQNQ